MTLKRVRLPEWRRAYEQDALQIGEFAELVALPT